jgi:hypothetical protein
VNNLRFRPTRCWRKMIGPGDVRRTAIAVTAKTGATRISPGMIHSKSNPRFQFDAHQELSLEGSICCCNGISVPDGRPCGTSRRIPPCAATEGAGAIYSDADGRYGSLLKVCDLQIHRTDVLIPYSSKTTWSLGRCITKWESSIFKEIPSPSH